MATHVIPLSALSVLLSHNADAQEVLERKHMRLDLEGSNERVLHLFNTEHPGVTYQISTDPNGVVYVVYTFHGHAEVSRRIVATYDALLVALSRA